MANQQEQKPLIEDIAGSQRVQAMTQERDNLDDSFFNAKKLLNDAIKKEQSGKKNGVTEDKLVTVIPSVATQIGCRVRIPIREYPRFNFVGKLLGPKGSTLKQLQLDTGTRMSILGRNSMRDKNKEEELRNGTDHKFEHLKMDLHVLIEAFCPAAEAYSRIGHALTEMKKYLTPDPQEEDGRQQGPMLGMGGHRGGRGRGAPPGRGMPRPLGGAPRGRPAAPRGAVRGGPRGRGAPPGRGRAAPRPLATYGQEEYYDESGYGEAYAETGYEEGGAEATTYGYAAETGAGDGYEYGGNYGGASQAPSYGGQAPPSTGGGSYGGYGSSGSSWSSGGGAGGPRSQMKAPSQYSQKPASRAHPYQPRY